MPDATIVDRYSQRHALLLEQLDAAVAQVWDSLGSWNVQDIPRFVARITPVLTAAETMTARTVDAYIARLIKARPVGIQPATNLRGLQPVEVWRRPFLDTWTAVGDGTDPSTALKIGRARVKAISAMDTQRAQVQAMTDIAGARPQIIGYRRTLTGKSCVFCATASTHIYHGKHLMPLHSHCDCGVAPIIGDRDPGLAANRARLKALKARGPDYWKQHGFVDAAGTPLDPTDLPGDLIKIEHNAEVGLTLNPAA